MKTLVSRNGLVTPGRVICSTWVPGAFPVLRLKRLGLSKACRRLVVTLIRRYAVGIVHLDAFGEVLPGFDIFDW